MFLCKMFNQSILIVQKILFLRKSEYIKQLDRLTALMADHQIPLISCPPLYTTSYGTQNTVVQSIELQGHRGGTGKSCQNCWGTLIAKLAGAASLMDAPF